jgi:hypothetical protein
LCRPDHKVGLGEGLAVWPYVLRATLVLLAHDLKLGLQLLHLQDAQVIAFLMSEFQHCWQGCAACSSFQAWLADSPPVECTSNHIFDELIPTVLADCASCS